MNTAAASARHRAILNLLRKARGQDPQDHLDPERVEELLDEAGRIEGMLEDAGDEERNSDGTI